MPSAASSARAVASQMRATAASQKRRALEREVINSALADARIAAGCTADSQKTGQLEQPSFAVPLSSSDEDDSYSDYSSYSDDNPGAEKGKGETSAVSQTQKGKGEPSPVSQIQKGKGEPLPVSQIQKGKGEPSAVSQTVMMRKEDEQKKGAEQEVAANHQSDGQVGVLVTVVVLAVGGISSISSLS